MQVKHPGLSRLIARRRPGVQYGAVPGEWFECTLDVPAEQSEIVASFLIDNGAPGVQSEERDGVTHLTAYFTEAPPREALVRLCAELGCPLAGNESIRVRRVAEENWAENWKDHFPPQLVGARLFVCPPWASSPPPGRIAVVIDPGMAFGTGHHATTRGCLQLLEHVVTERAIVRALDVGTGSGVLAIALAKLGVAEVWAVDTDPNACAVAAANAAANGVHAAVRVRPALEEVAGKFDLVVANLFANLLEELASRLAALVRPDGVLICSGFLTTDATRILQTYAAAGLHPIHHHEDDSWVTLALERSRVP